LSKYINNLIIMFLLLFIFFGIFFIIKKDIYKIQQHIENCKKECYPGIVVEQFSRYKCLCQNEVELKY